MINDKTEVYVDFRVSNEHDSVKEAVRKITNYLNVYYAYHTEDVYDLLGDIKCKDGNYVFRKTIKVNSHFFNSQCYYINEKLKDRPYTIYNGRMYKTMVLNEEPGLIGLCSIDGDVRAVNVFDIDCAFDHPAPPPEESIDLVGLTFQYWNTQAALHYYPCIPGGSRFVTHRKKCIDGINSRDEAFNTILKICNISDPFRCSKDVQESRDGLPK